MRNDQNVYIKEINKFSYPDKPPYNPNKKFPEYPFYDGELDKSNNVYEYVRELLYDMGLDKQNFGKGTWNPFKEIISPGDMVVIKPNLVMHENQLKQYSTDCVITNGSIIRVIVDYAYIALNGSGKIIIADAPMQKCNFEQVIYESGIKHIKDFYKEKHSNIEVIDFRKEKAVTDSNGNIIRIEKLNGDPRGYTAVDLKSNSMLYDIVEDFERFRVTNYEPSLMREHHNKEKNEYLIPNSILQADVIINVPKPKTHRKAGITGALKNLVGINGSKDWLPHHRQGSIHENGDEYLHGNVFKKSHVLLQEKIDANNIKGNLKNTKIMRLIQKINSIFRKIISKDDYMEGSWWGNDTIWRTVCDLNRLLIYADKKGLMQKEIQRRCISFLDMIISGEGEGPLKPSPKRSGIIMAGFNPLIVDTALAKIMGFDYKKIPNISKAYEINDYPISNLKVTDIIIKSNNKKWAGTIEGIKYENTLKYIPASGWKNHIEII
jgi:uncharacterized protein (DUF362 family)